MFAKDKFIILMYHRVLQSRDEIYPEEITATEFERHAKVLSRFFNVIHLSDALDLLSSGRLPARSVAITFDDGYRDNATVALPILKKYGLVATFFIATGYSGGKLMWNDKIAESIRNFSDDDIDLSERGIGRFSVKTNEQKRAAIESIMASVKYLAPDDREQAVDHIVRCSKCSLPTHLMMNSEEIDTLLESGMEIGAHTVSHPILRNLGDEEATAEISNSRKTLEDTYHTDVQLFAYPNGRFGQDFDERDQRIVEELGFRAAVSTNLGCVKWDSNQFALPRHGAWDTDPFRFALRLAKMLLKN